MMPGNSVSLRRSRSERLSRTSSRTGRRRISPRASAAFNCPSVSMRGEDDIYAYYDSRAAFEVSLERIGVFDGPPSPVEDPEGFGEVSPERPLAAEADLRGG